MNRTAMFASLFCLAALCALPGCSPGPNVPDDGMTLPDGGNQDVVPNDDQAPPPDGDPSDTPVAACYPSRSTPDFAPCATAPSCECRIDLDPHIGTFAGTPCFHDDGWGNMVPDPDMMPTCLAGTTCAPGRNHCSMDLLPGIDAAPFEPQDLLLNHSWWGVHGRATFAMYSANGVVMTTLSDSTGTIFSGACSGRSCYDYGYLASQKPMQVRYQRLESDSTPDSVCIHTFPLGSIPNATDLAPLGPDRECLRMSGL